jgi:hypothetical protein
MMTASKGCGQAWLFLARMARHLLLCNVQGGGYPVIGENTLFWHGVPYDELSESQVLLFSIY